MIEALLTYPESDFNRLKSNPVGRHVTCLYPQNFGFECMCLQTKVFRFNLFLATVKLAIIPCSMSKIYTMCT